MAAQTPLFGGSVSVLLPAGFRDLSLIRPVPDNQEVYAEAAADGAVVIVEVVEFQEAVAGGALARYLWEDVAECNGAAASRWRELPAPRAEGAAAAAEPPPLLASPRCSAACCGLGFHEAPESGEGGAASLTCVALGALRLPGVASELVVTAAVPVAGAAGAAEARAEALLSALLPTLCVHDWGLFGGAEEK